MSAALELEGNVGKAIRIAKDLLLPLETVTQTIAILARKRAGKTFTLRRLFEELVRAGQQVVDIDPKGDHWGIRYAADGKSPGLGVLILGGEHGDLPLEVGAGELVAKLVVEERVSVLLDLSHFRKHEVITFVTAFAETMYRLKAREEFRTPLMLLLDEADIVAPQAVYDEGQKRMIGAFDDIVRRGGQRGIGCAFATQRSAVLNKNILTQAQVLVALRTIAPQDLKAMDEWIQQHGTREQRAILMESLPSLPRGDAWFWSPGWPDDQGIFQRVHVDPIKTFDSGKTPEPGAKRVVPRGRADVDLEAVRRQMADLVERKKATDPTLLRKRVAELEKEKARLEREVDAARAKPAKPPKDGKPDPKLGALVRRLNRALEEAMKFIVKIDAEGFLKAGGEVVDKAGLEKAIAAAVEQATRRFEAQLEHRNKELARLRAEAGRVLQALRGLKDENAAEIEVAVRHQEPFAVRAPAEPRADSRSRGFPRALTAPPPEGVSKGSMRVLEVLARNRAPMTRAQLGVVAGYEASAGSFGNLVYALTGSHLAEGVKDGAETRYAPTAAGLALLGEVAPRPTPDEILARWRPKYSPASWQLLEFILERGPMTRQELGDAAQKVASAGSFGNTIYALTGPGVLVRQGDGRFAVNPVILEGGTR